MGKSNESRESARHRCATHPPDPSGKSLHSAKPTTFFRHFFVVVVELVVLFVVAFVPRLLFVVPAEVCAFFFFSKVYIAACCKIIRFSTYAFVSSNFISVEVFDCGLDSQCQISF